MHYGWNDGWSTWNWAAMTIGMIVLWGFVLWAVFALVRSSGGSSDDKSQTPEQILARRFAAGEIDTDEYDRRLEALRPAEVSDR